MKIFRRLGVSPMPVMFCGPVITRLGTPPGFVNAAFTRKSEVDLVDPRAALTIGQRQADGVRTRGDLQSEAAWVVDFDLFPVECEVDAGTSETTAQREVIVRIDGEGVVNQEPTACAERKPIDVAILRKPRRRRKRHL